MQADYARMREHKRTGATDACCPRKSQVIGFSPEQTYYLPALCFPRFIISLDKLRQLSPELFEASIHAVNDEFGCALGSQLE